MNYQEQTKELRVHLGNVERLASIEQDLDLLRNMRTSHSVTVKIVGENGVVNREFMGDRATELVAQTICSLEAGFTKLEREFFPPMLATAVSASDTPPAEAEKPKDATETAATSVPGTPAEAYRQAAALLNKALLANWEHCSLKDKVSQLNAIACELEKAEDAERDTLLYTNNPGEWAKGGMIHAFSSDGDDV